MLYTNLEFGFFFLAFFLLYWSIHNHIKGQNLLILAASYFFYGWWDWRFLSLIVVSSLTDFLIGIQLDQGGKHKKKWLYISLFVNLGLLGVFKYYNFFVDSFIDLFALFDYQLPARTLEVILPIGISFYTFQTLSYSIDVYRGKVQHTRDVVAFLAFVSFFPQLIAGPIERASSFLPQFSRKRTFDSNTAKDGIRQVLWGLFKKVVIADGVAQAVETILGHHELYTGAELFMGLLFFAFQVYCDFSGYSDIAIGLGKLLGFKLMTNFKYPLTAPNFLQAWSRWHISLISWFKDYIYFPLGGSRGSPLATMRNLIIVFVVSGFWHGANWTFIFWGLLCGVLGIPEQVNKKLLAKDIKPIDAARFRAPLSHYLRVATQVSLNTLGLALFFSRDLAQAGGIYAGIFDISLLSIPGIFREELLLIFGFYFIEWICQHKEHPLKIEHLPVFTRWTVYYVVVMTILYFNYDRIAFIYFQF